MERTGVRLVLLLLFCGVLYVFGSLAVLVLTAKEMCSHRLLFALFALSGFALLACTGWAAATRRDGSRAVFLLPAVFFLLGTGIPAWMLSHALKVCAAAGAR